MSPLLPPADPTLADRLAQADRPLLSYEFFPPKNEKGLVSLQATIEGLLYSRPDFVTVTYGAGGSTRNLTFEIAELLRRFRFGPVMPHLTCVGSSRAELEDIADRIHADGYRNIMTLRGDPPKGAEAFVPAADGLACARDLVHLLKKRHADFCLGVAGYPEGHPESTGPGAEMDYLKSKIDAGASFVTTQLFFDNRHYHRFVDRCRAAGITVPILPGIMPALSLSQVHRITSLCGASLPQGLVESLESAGGEGDSARNAGILWCTHQIVDLLQKGVPGVHLYILNQVQPALAYELAKTFLDLTRRGGA